MNRRPVSVHVRLAVVAVAFLLACAVAGSGRAAQAAGAPVSGSFVDALRNAIPNVTLTLTNTETGEKQTSRSGADGSFTFDALPDGDYRGETSAPGFTDTHPFFRIVKGKSVQPSVIALALGSVEETVTVTSAPRPPTGAPVGSPVFRPRNPSDTISPPRKTRDVRAIYPPNRTSDEATVFLEGVIDTNGLMRGLQALQPADRDFAAAAMDAVNQWQFEPTLLHGVPVDTAIRITVGFVR